MFKKFVNLSLNLRTFSTQLNVTNSFNKCKTATKGKVRHISNRSLKADELLHNQISTVVVPIKVLECLLETNNQKISGKNIIDATDSLLKLCKQEKLFKGGNKLIIEKMLYTLVNVHKDKIQVFEAVEILKLLMKIRISDSSEVVKTILEIINNLIHNLEFKDYNFVCETLIKVKKTHLVETINDKLKKNFIVKMSTDFDANNLDLLTEMLRYASNNLTDKLVFQIIVDSLKSEHFKSIPVANAVSIMKSLCTMTPLPARWHEVLPLVQSSLISNIDQVTVEDVQSILYKIALRIRDDRIDGYYNSSLLDHFAQKIVMNDIGFENAVNCLRNFISIRHIPKKLLSYISAKHYEEKQINRRISNSYLEKLLCLVNGLAYLKYKPIFWDEIYSALKTPRILMFTNEMLVNYSLHLSCLDCYDFAVLERIFQAQYRYNTQQFLHWRLLYLWQNIKTKSNYDGPLPPQEMIDSFKSLNRINTCPLLPSLNEIIGEGNFKTDLRTKLHHQIDHVLAFEGKDKPVAINNNIDETGVQYLEDLKVSDNTEIVAILFLPRWWYLANVDELIGPYQAYVQSLETLTRHVIVIPDQVWNMMAVDSRTDFLENEINTKLYSVANDC